MADNVYAFSPSIPAHTTSQAPATLPLVVPVGEIDRIEFRIPPGNNFLVGYQMWCGGGLVLPHNPNSYIVGDDDLLGWELDDLPESGAWSLVGYNSGQFAHVIYVRFFLSLGGVNTDTVPAPIQIVQQVVDTPPLMLS